ncbi:hypothetical protein [Phragmitibacter flavus]|uniref:hypothetical protein n=1 Tax=Phragmitibacter flavus TaxID=2576071 RepID=UPI00140C2AD9|nr:hypothetical protein [Phragmitibacter flavus]
MSSLTLAVARLEKAAELLKDESMPVEVEHEDRVISQYTIEGHETWTNFWRRA